MINEWRYWSKVTNDPASSEPFCHSKKKTHVKIKTRKYRKLIKTNPRVKTKTRRWKIILISDLEAEEALEVDQRDKYPKVTNDPAGSESFCHSKKKTYVRIQTRKHCKLLKTKPRVKTKVRIWKIKLISDLEAVEALKVGSVKQNYLEIKPKFVP